MNKVVELLEQHCQWLAIALGGLFLGWALWAYGVVEPVQVGTLTPGNVDETVWNTVGKSMEEKIKGPAIPAPPQASNNARDKWKKIVTGQVQYAPIAAANWWTGGIPDAQRNKVEEDKNETIVKIEKLPTLPPAEMLGAEHIKSGRVMVQMALAPGATPPPAPTTPGAPPPGAKDINYVRGEFRITMAELDKAFRAVNVPLECTTSVIGIKVMRQEMQPSGDWSKATEIKTIAEGAVIQPIPADNAGTEAITAFRTWAETNEAQTALLRPAFYQIVSGEGPWDIAAPKAVDTEEKPKPQPRPPVTPRPTPAPRATPTPRPTPPPGAGAGRRGGGGEYAPQDGARPSTLGGIATPVQFRDPRIGAGEGNPEGGGGYNPQPQAGNGAPDAGQLPDAVFMPSKQPNNIVSWFYDGTVVEGKTYRYQVIYTLRNPMYLDSRLADPKLQNQFAIESKLDENAWSESRTVESTSRYYLSMNPWIESSNINAAKFEVFKWAGGKWQSWVFTVPLGGKIGETHAGVDYSTGVTLVDIRYDKPDSNGRPYVVLMGQDTSIIERDVSTDKNDPNRADLSQKVKDAAPPADNPGGVPAAPGYPTPPGGRPNPNVERGE